MLLFQLILKVPFEVDQCRIIVKVLMHIESKIIHGIVIESSPCCCSLIMRFIHQTKHNIRIKILFTYLVEEIWFQAQTQHGLTIDCFDSEKKYICHYSYFYFSHSSKWKRNKIISNYSLRIFCRLQVLVFCNNYSWYQTSLIIQS